MKYEAHGSAVATLSAHLTAKLLSRFQPFKLQTAFALGLDRQPIYCISGQRLFPSKTALDSRCAGNRTEDQPLRNILNIFFQAHGTQPLIVLVCLLLAGLAEGFGLASLLPIMSIALGSANETPSPTVETILE